MQLNCKNNTWKQPYKQQKQNKYYFRHIVLFKNAIFDYSSSTIFIKNDLHEGNTNSGKHFTLLQTNEEAKV